MKETSDIAKDELGRQIEYRTKMADLYQFKLNNKELLVKMREEYNNEKDNEKAQKLLQQIVDIEEDQNECLVHTLQKTGEIMPAFKKYSEGYSDKIKKEFDQKKKDKLA